MDFNLDRFHISRLMNHEADSREPSMTNIFDRRSQNIHFPHPDSPQLNDGFRSGAIEILEFSIILALIADSSSFHDVSDERDG